MLLPRPLVPIDPYVPCRPPRRDDVDSAVAIEIGGGEVFDGDAAGIDIVASPFIAFVVERFVNADAATLIGFHAEIVADSDDDLVALIRSHIKSLLDWSRKKLRTPDSMAPFQLVINHNSLDGVFCWWSKEGLQRTSGFGSPGPHDPSAAIGVHIDDNLIAVPRLN